MSSSLFRVVNHVVDGQHVREYPHAISNGDAILRLSVREYRPIEQNSQLPGPVTIIAAHANGIQKETYEPMWDELLRQQTFQIGSIWIADLAWQGYSGILNEAILGDDPSWFDHARDLLQVINQFRGRMTRPIIGIGHSVGACILTKVALMHPRLLHSLVSIEPVILPRVPPRGPNVAFASTFRRDLWESRAAAERDIRRSPFFRTWDPRALDLFIQHGLRDTPTALYPSAPEGSVTLTTTKHQEVWTFARPNFRPVIAADADKAFKLMHPDMDHAASADYAFVRPEMEQVFGSLNELRPSVLYVMGRTSHLSPKSLVELRTASTGTGRGGSGGPAAGKVKEAWIEDAGHMTPFERMADTAGVIGSWIVDELQTWKEQEAWFQAYDSQKSENKRRQVSKTWMENVKLPMNTPRDGKGKL